MIQLIVHADDFGLCEEINEGIKKAHTDGIVTSASIMANGKGFGHALSVARSTPDLDLGVHLTLVEEKPLSDIHLIPSIVTEKGDFHPNTAAFFRHYLKGKIDSEHLLREMDLQIEKSLDSGLQITHLDSHQHVHMIPGVYRQVVKLAEKYGINAIRVPRESISGYMLSNGKLRRTLDMTVLNLISRWSQNDAYSKTRFFAGFYYGGNLNKKNLLHALSGMKKPGVYELMCHPGNKPVDGSYSHWNYQWENELSALTDREVIDLISNRGISLISYRDLSRFNSLSA